jgi:hypothetical protein
MEYQFYLLPTFEKHEEKKYCYSFDQTPENINQLLINSHIEKQFENKELCTKCAFHCQLWYDDMILERKKFIYSPKSFLSKYSFNQFDFIYDQIDHPTIHCISYEKVKNVFQELSKKRAYKQSDIDAYDKTMEILKWINEMYEKYKVCICYEEIL